MECANSRVVLKVKGQDSYGLKNNFRGKTLIELIS